MSYHAPDLTGTHPLHEVKDDIFTIFRPNQRIYFHTPVFFDSIKIKVVGSPLGEALLPSEFTFEEVDKDLDTLSRIKVYDSSFDKNLVNSIVITKVPPVGTEYQIAVSYNRLYPNRIRTATYNQDTLEFTAELAISMLEEIDNLRLQTSRTKDISTVTSHEVGSLELDISKTNINNYVTDERHEIDVPSGVYTIYPIYGSFYNDDTVKVQFITGSLTDLVKDKDYKIVGMDVPKTRVTTSTAPVYNYIVIIKPMVGTVKISYHAFGGEPTIKDYKNVNLQLKYMTEYLNGAKFLTESNLNNTATITAITERLLQMEEQMRVFLNGKASYGDKTSGISRLYKITAADSDIHWWTIASLYKVEGSDDIITADRMHFRVSTLYSKFLFDVYVSINLNNPVGERLKINVISENYPRGYVPFLDYTGVDNLIQPQFRAIWNESTSTKSGVLLQIGLPLKQILTESVGVEDLSGSECCWKLVNKSDNAFPPMDNVIELPAKTISGDPIFVWDASNPNSSQESTLLPFSEGHLIWAGVRCLNRPGGWNHFNIPHFLDKTIDYTRVKKIRLELSERGSYTFPVDVTVMKNNTTLTGTTTTNYYKEPFDVVIVMDRDEVTKDITLQLNTSVSGDAIALDLMGVVIYT